MSRNSKVILAKNIKLDKNYKSVLKYTEDQMLELMTNSNNLVFQSNTCSFIREENIINVKATYGTCIQANYVAFQNPDYSNKWFFGFIDNIRYLNNGVCEIHFTTDIFTTWWSYWSPRACFTIREHVEDDTIGLHTVPENVETGDYVIVDESTLNYGNFYICVAVSEDILSQDTPAKSYNGVASGLTYIALQNKLDVDRLIVRYTNAQKIEAIYALFMIPEGYINPIIWQQDATGGINYMYVRSTDTPFDLGNIALGRRNILGYGDVGYTPKNNKLLTYPFQYILADNNAGSTAIYKYEYFLNPLYCEFQAYGTINPGCNIKVVPRNYEGIYSSSQYVYNYAQGINGAKIPVGGWTTDVFTNWLTQNGINIATSIGGSALQIAGGLALASSGAGALAGAGNITSGIMSIASTVGSIYQHSKAPDQAEGNINSSDIMFSLGKSGVSFYTMSIKEEMAEIIDNYFSRMGYQVNKVKVPNMQHRQNFNFVQIGAEENLAYPNNYNDIGIPASALNQINDMFRSGITLWNSHGNFGDYSVSNDIV